jgi:hypothetical protein
MMYFLSGALRPDLYFFLKRTCTCTHLPQRMQLYVIQHLRETTKYEHIRETKPIDMNTLTSID